MDTNSTNSQNILTSWIAFVKAHEKLIIIILSALLLYRTGQGIENIILKHDAKSANEAATVVQQDTVSNKQLQQTLSEMKANADAQAIKLKTDIQSQIANLAAQQKKDSTLSPNEIDARWQTLLPIKPGSVTPIDSAETRISNEAANQTVQALEEIPVLKTEVFDLTTELNTSNGIVIQQDKTILGLNTQIVDEKASHIQDVKLEKAKSRRSWLRGFKVGLVVGAVGTEAVRIMVGHP